VQLPVTGPYAALSGLGAVPGVCRQAVLYDMRALETLVPILSFFVLGVILVGVSWILHALGFKVQRYYRKNLWRLAVASARPSQSQQIVQSGAVGGDL